MPYQEQNFGTGFLGSLNESLQSQNIGKFILQSILQGHQRALGGSTEDASPSPSS